MKQIAAKLGLVTASVLACVLALEIALRVIGYGTVGDREGNVVHHRVDEFEHDVVLNSLDLRDAEVPARPPGELRILALGDSFTYGLGVEEEETFVRRTEGVLRRRTREAGLPKRVRVVNAGIFGGPYRHAEWLRNVGLGLEPDLVVHTFFIGNDIYDDIVWRQRGGRASPGGVDADGLRASLRRSVFLDWLWARMVLLPVFDRLLFKAGLRYGDRGLFLTEQRELEKQAWKATLAKMLEMQRMLEARGVLFLVMIVPTSDQVRYGRELAADQDYRLPNAILTGFLAEHDVPFLDLLPLIEQQADRDAFYYRRDLHWTAEGHRFAASLLSERLWSLLVAEGRLSTDRPGAPG